MATKGQKFKKYSDTIKQKAIDNIKKGKSINYISNHYNIPHGTFSN